MTMITTTKDLRSLCTKLKKSEFITVDTEFIREKTYWPHLCLIQVAGDDGKAFAIDPLADGINLSAFYDLMQNEKVLKVFHACRQDIEIFLHETGKIPTPIFDTQIAAMVCGFGDQVGYEALVKAIAKKKIDKSSRYTDWSLRPLSAKQLKYALADVTHLRKIYKKLVTRLEKDGRISWIKSEMRSLTHKSSYITKPREAWERIRMPHYKPRAMCILREIAAWREKTAQEHDVPRGRVLRDDALAEIATHAPDTPEKLEKIRNVHKGFSRSDRGKSLMKAIEKGIKADIKKAPERQRRAPLPPGLKPTIELLRVLLKYKCDEENVAQKILCSASDLEQIAAFGKDAKVPAVSGWRYKVFGKQALELRDGKLAIAVSDGHLKLVKSDH